MAHTIYHIQGRKVGCTNNFERRKSQYPEGTEFEIIEILENKSDQEAGDREWFWADHFGYNRGEHYVSALTKWRLANKAAQLPAAKEKNRQSRLGQKRGPSKLKGTKFPPRPPGQKNKPRSAEQLQRYLEVNPWAGKLGSEMSSRVQAELLSIGRHHSQLKVACPHCGKKGSSNIMKRWHFNRCKFKN